MRNLINIVTLTEGATFYPATFDAPNKTFGLPDELRGNREKECAVCNGAGNLSQYDGYSEDDKCSECEGTGKFETEEWKHSMSTDYRNGRVLWQIMGVEPDGDSEHIPPQELPQLRERLVSYISGEAGSVAQPHQVEGGMQVDRSESLPRLTSGATIHTAPIFDSQIVKRAERLLEIVDYAIEHSLWLVWA